jgi:hypothetical protein
MDRVMTKEKEIAKQGSMPRLISLLIALCGCLVTALPFVFSVGGNPVPLILIGSGVTVVALGLFLFFSI